MLLNYEPSCANSKYSLIGEKLQHDTMIGIDPYKFKVSINAYDFWLSKECVQVFVSSIHYKLDILLGTNLGDGEVHYVERCIWPVSCLIFW